MQLIQWTVVDGDGNDASAYAEVTVNRNRQPVLNALKPNDGEELYLVYQPKGSITTTEDFLSNSIELTINQIAVSDVSLEGSFNDFILNDGANAANVAGLTVTAKDENGSEFDTAGKVKWHTEDTTGGLTIDETTGAIAFIAPALTRFMPWLTVPSPTPWR